MGEIKDQIVKDIKERTSILNALFVGAAKEGVEVNIKRIDHSLTSSNQTHMEIKVTLKEIL